MRRIELDARRWRTEADLIEAVIEGLHGPPWHGRNYNALRDSMVSGSVNEIDAPYAIVFTGTGCVCPEVDQAISYFIDRVSAWVRDDGAKISAERID